jgi:hypothetical protein
MLAPSAFGGIVTFIGSDVGASAPGSGSNTAAANFDAAASLIGTESFITFESPLVATNGAANQTIPLGGNVSVSGGSIDIRNTPVPGCGASLCGANTTAGGSQWLDVDAGTATFTFVRPIQYFGAYFGGLQGNSAGQETITFSDGSSETVNIPELSSGFAFAGFTDAGASISSVSVNMLGDIASIDDVRYGPLSPVPEPASGALLGGVFLVGLIARMRRKSR